MNEKISGVMMYYYIVCKRKLWYFSHEIRMEEDDENVKIGKIIDEQSYQRDDKHINIDNVINIDFVRNKNILHEVKKSRTIEDATIWQLKYYLFYLKQKGVSELKGKIDYPLLKKTLSIELTVTDEEEILRSLREIKDIIVADVPPNLEKDKKICKKCAYYELCFI